MGFTYRPKVNLDNRKSNREMFTPSNYHSHKGDKSMNSCKIPVEITGIDEAIDEAMEKVKELKVQLNKTKAIAAELEEQLKGLTVTIQM